MFKRVSPRKGRLTPRKGTPSKPVSPLVEIRQSIEDLNEYVEIIRENAFLLDENKKSFKRKQNNRQDDDGPVTYLKIEEEVEGQMVELIRRIAEIAVQEEQQFASCFLRGGESWNNGDERNELKNRPNEVAEEQMSHVGNNEVFEYFCEANVLRLFIDIATGLAFVHEQLQDSSFASIEGNESMDTNDAVVAGLGSLSFDSPRWAYQSSVLLPKRLPSVNIAIQVLQSISILIQNVKLSTSLYLILSNPKLNELIYLALDSYAVAEKYEQQQQEQEARTTSSYQSQQEGRASSSCGELSELTNIFISFLKSLTMKMNPETLQFYLFYPCTSTSKDSSSSFHTTSSPIKHSPADINQIQFPLYERALQFCNPEEDPFVRVTAMNLCLNTLRLATDGDPLPPPSDGSHGPLNAECDSNVSTDGASSFVVENSKIQERPDRNRNPSNTSRLPFRERLAISYYVCQPSRVQFLSAGIFTRLASLCGKVEETIRTLDRIDRALSACFVTIDQWTKESSSSAVDKGDPKDGTNEDASNTKNMEGVQKKIKILQSERIKVVKHFLGDTVSDFQDELMLLEDILKVGLIPLNEQIIEMMFPTVIYPLVLTPLHNFIKQNKRSSTNEGGTREPDPFSDRFEKHMSRPVSRGASSSESDSSLAKSALFVIASLYHYITHKELLQLLLTALLHPLAPEISNASTIVQTSPDILYQDNFGYTHIKTDALHYAEGLALYTFGCGDANNHLDTIKSKGSFRQDCVFVFCPILSDIFEWSMAGWMPNGVPDNLTANRYRRTLLSCLSGTDGMAELQALAVYAIDAIVSTMRGEVLDCILFGTRIIEEVEFRSSTPAQSDESLNSDATSTVSASNELAFSASVSQHMVEFIASMCVSVITAAISYDGLWSLRYNAVAAHAILRMCMIDSSVNDIAKKFIQYRRNQSGKFILKTPSRLDKYSHDKKEMDSNLKMDKVFFEAFCEGDKFVAEHIIRKHGSHPENLWRSPAMIPVAKDGSIFQLAKQICEDISAKHVIGHDCEEAAYRCAANSAVSHMQLDSFSRLITDKVSSNSNFHENGYAGVASFALSISTAREFHKSGNNLLICPISDIFSTLLFEDEYSHDECPTLGEVVKISERKPFPCVCEITKENEELITDGGACIVADGVKWQSLYLVIVNKHVILAEPLKGESAGYGRVVMACPILCLVAELYDIQDKQSSAQRILLTHLSFTKHTPGLFTAEKAEDLLHSSDEVRINRSCLDVWFEDYNNAAKAHKALCSRIFKARIERGKKVHKALAHHETL